MIEQHLKGYPSTFIELFEPPGEGRHRPIRAKIRPDLVARSRRGDRQGQRKSCDDSADSKPSHDLMI